ncbi:glycosyltransferase family 9 protein [Microbacterium sp. Marseille-Q6965]|uniref:glycosyltransferase family 9 protein n=1 Tax=Microbacterium sp. Marseille-Q6965 TaxID=2965072 RepID=UPI0021B6EFE5|nr:glycosyltransferase family 9 protein [Microbacterium sp. Marseille-Q6965]
MRALGCPDGRPELLALRALKLGDLLVAVPAIRGLRRAFPDHRLVLAVPAWLEPVVELIGGVDALLPTPGLDELLPLDPGRIDVAVNLHGSGPESRRLVDALAARVRMVHRVDEIDGDVGDPAMPEWRDDLHERQRWVRLVGAYGVAADPNEVGLQPAPATDGLEAATVLHVGAAYGSRLWPVDRFAAVARALADDGHRVVFTGSAKERERAVAVAEAAGLGTRAVRAGDLDLARFAGVIQRARLVVSADTGAAHLASAYGTPSVVLFGPAAPEHWGPPPGPHTVLTAAHLRRGDTFADEPDPAILGVSVDDVLAAARRAAP